MKYFLHDTNAFNDEKITELFIKFGYEGLGLFFTILERIAMQEKPIKTSVLKQQLKVGKKLEKCWLFLEEIKLISSSNGETFNERILSYSKKYQVLREKNLERVKKHRSLYAEKEEDVGNVTALQPHYNHECNAPKGIVSKSIVSKEGNGYGVLFSIEHCITVAMNDSRWVKANKVTENELKEFNHLLEKRGVYQKNPFDYKTHFANWKVSGKKESALRQEEPNQSQTHRLPKI